MADETYKNHIFDDLTLPLSLIEKPFELIDSDNSSLCCIGEILIDNVKANYQEIVDALEAKFGNIEIEHDKYGKGQIYPWGKVVGVSSDK